MARTNKYSSINFNDIYEKKVINSGSNLNSSSAGPTPSHSSSSATPSLASPNRTALANSRIHGHMLVLSKPAASKPKPIAIPQSQPQKATSLAPTTASSKNSAPAGDQTVAEQDSISLRPQGRTGSSSPVVVSPLPSPGKPSSPLTSSLLKTDRFVPPHLRPGFLGREEKPGPEFVRGGEGGRGRGQIVRQNVYGEEGRPKSGGGYDKMKTIGCEPEPMNILTPPGSGGGRPRSSG